MSSPPPSALPAARGEGSCPHFTDIHSAAGIDFHYRNGSVGKALMVEATGGGAGWLDFDRDGVWDLYLVQGGNPAWKSLDENPNDELFRQVSPGKWSSCSVAAGIEEHGYGQGVSIADYDNDGFADLYVTNVGRNTLFKNQGDGTFREVTEAAGVVEKRWSTSSAWGDLDADGDLDLYVCTYVVYDPYNPLPCHKPDGSPTTCHPEQLSPEPDVCFENLGDGTFREVAQDWGLVGEGSKSLGVVIADFNADRLPDIYVANDTTANFVFINRGGRNFEERGIPLGGAMSGDGLFQASMGVAFGDYNRDGFPDLYVTHFTSDFNTLYENLQGHGFQDVTQYRGLVAPTLKFLGFGTVMADFDRNGQQELFITNGHVDDYREDGAMFHMPPQLFSYTGERWHDCSAVGGEIFKESFLGRSAASCDFDNDGDLDLAVVHQNAPAALLRNDAAAGHWCKLRFVGTVSSREGWLTKVSLRQGESTYVQQLPGGTSYCSSHEPALLFGLPSAEPFDLEVEWLSGVRQEFRGLTVDQERVIEEPARASGE